MSKIKLTRAIALLITIVLTAMLVSPACFVHEILDHYVSECTEGHDDAWGDDAAEPTAADRQASGFGGLFVFTDEEGKYVLGSSEALYTFISEIVLGIGQFVFIFSKYHFDLVSVKEFISCLPRFLLLLAAANIVTGNTGIREVVKAANSVFLVLSITKIHFIICFHPSSICNRHKNGFRDCLRKGLSQMLHLHSPKYNHFHNYRRTRSSSRFPKFLFELLSHIASRLP